MFDHPSLRGHNFKISKLKTLPATKQHQKTLIFSRATPAFFLQLEPQGFYPEPKNYPKGGYEF
jgi:hypothetical protein